MTAQGSMFGPSYLEAAEARAARRADRARAAAERAELARLRAAGVRCAACGDELDRPGPTCTRCGEAGIDTPCLGL